ncbi:MAG: hypothetical protein IJN64_18750 [Lachnospiraceae bacterium]|nr:hypothetical protein [Lachnospiraceae bacterium]
MEAVSADRNAELLQNVPHERMEDMAYAIYQRQSCFYRSDSYGFLGKAAQKILMSCFINWKMPDTRLSVESMFH